MRPGPDVQHLLITPFNVRRPEGPSHGLDDEWLAHRLPLFERMCVPSVAAQTSRDVRWMILVDPATPSVTLARIRRAVDRIGILVHLVEVGGWDEVDARVWALAADGAAITSRLDNDDALSRTHIEDVRRCVDEGANAVQFTSGAALFATTGRAYRLLQRHSPFYSIVAELGAPTAATVDQRVVVERWSNVAEVPMGFVRLLHDRNLIGTNGTLGRRLDAPAIHRLAPVDPAFLEHGSRLGDVPDAAVSVVRELQHTIRRRAGLAREALRGRRA